MVEKMERNWSYLLVIFILMMSVIGVCLKYVNLESDYRNLRQLVYNNKALHSCVVKYLDDY